MITEITPNQLRWQIDLEEMDWTYEYSEHMPTWRREHGRLNDLMKGLLAGHGSRSQFNQASKKYPDQIVLKAMLKNKGL